MKETSGAGYSGQSGVSSWTSQFNAIQFLIKQFMGLVRTATIVQVQSCTNDGGISAIGTVDVLPLVNLIDGLGYSTPHGIVHGVPYCRVQGGGNAVIVDPQEGDIGLAVFADRDISSVKASGRQSPPGSRRRFNMSDGLYVFTIMGAAPTQYWRFSSDGMSAEDKNGNTIVMDSSGVTINGVLIDRSANVSGAGTVQASGEGTFNGHTVGAHTHGGVQTGSGTTAPPTG